jgi:hypothetical protein
MAVQPDIARDYLVKLVKETGKRPSRLAKEAGLSQTTVTRPLSPTYSKTINLDTLIKLRDSHKVPFTPELEAISRKAGTRLRPLAEPSTVKRAHMVTDLVAELYPSSREEKAELFEKILEILSESGRRA